MNCPIGPDGEVRHLYVATQRTCLCGKTTQTQIDGRQQGKTERQFDDALRALEHGSTVYIKLPNE